MLFNRELTSLYNSVGCIYHQIVELFFIVMQLSLVKSNYRLGYQLVNFKKLFYFKPTELHHYQNCMNNSIVYKQSTIMCFVEFSIILSFFLLSSYNNFMRSAAFYIFILRNTIVKLSIVVDVRGWENPTLGGVHIDNPHKSVVRSTHFAYAGGEGGREGKLNSVRRGRQKVQSHLREQKLRHYVSNAASFLQLPINFT